MSDKAVSDIKEKLAHRLVELIKDAYIEGHKEGLVNGYSDIPCLAEEDWEDSDTKKGKEIKSVIDNHYKLVEALEAIKKHQEAGMQRGRYELSTIWNIATRALAEVKS